jgi:hypothetical protein
VRGLRVNKENHFRTKLCGDTIHKRKSITPYYLGKILFCETRKFNSAHGSMCSHVQSKHFKNVKIFRTKNLHLCLDILCIHTKFHKKLTSFIACVKMKETSHKQPSLTPRTSHIHNIDMDTCMHVAPCT